MKNTSTICSQLLIRLSVGWVLCALLIGQAPQPAQNPNGDAAAQTVEDLIKESLPEEMSAWIYKAQNNNGRLLLRSNFPYMTDTGYKNYMNEICKIVVANPIRFRGINDFSLTNRLGRQGYIYQTPQNCAQVVENHEKDPPEYDIFSDTRFCSRDCT